MKARRRKLVSWLLLVIPTVVMASAAVLLLHQERERLRLASLESVKARAYNIVENIDLAVADVKVSLMESLERLPSEGLPDALWEWQSSSSLVCSAFTCSETGDVRRPSQDGVPPYDLTVLQGDGGFAWELKPPRIAKATSPGTPFEGSKGARQNLKMKAAWGQEKPSSQKAWVYDAEGQSFRLAAWLRPSPSADVRALEVSVDSLLEDLRRAFPDRLETSEAYALIDPAGNIVHRHPDSIPDQGTSFVLKVGNELPGWHVGGYHLWKRSWSAKGFWLGSLLVGLLALATFFGGAIVYRQAGQESALAAQRTMFVSNVSHELKTPLTSIRMYAEIMREGQALEPAKQTRYLDVIVSESQRLTRLVNNVLDFSCLDRGKRDFSIAPHDIDQLIKKALATQRFAIEKAEFEIEWERSRKPLLAYVDPDATERILLNLIDNALKYAADGKWLSIGAAADVGMIVIRVTDRGPGIPVNQREKIFTRFHRLDDQLTSQSGAGLGLSIAQMLAEGMNGSLQCVTEPNHLGATLELKLPRANV